MAKLTLNFFDATRGVAMPDIEVEVQKIHDGGWQMLAQLSSGLNGDISVTREEAGGDLSGYYEATARTGNYFMDAGYVLPTLKFIDVVPIRFGISEPDADTTICINITPYGYSFQAR